MKKTSGSPKGATNAGQTFFRQLKFIICKDNNTRFHRHPRLYRDFIQRMTYPRLTYNELELTKKCLASIERYTDKDKIELVIVDNGSSDGTREYSPPLS
jgi:hypothetical protein